MTKIPHPHPISGAEYSAVELMLDDAEVLLLEQRDLPEREHYVRIQSAETMARAITDMVVRGAPAIGVAAAYGMVLAARSAEPFVEGMRRAAQVLRQSRPTAVNLMWAVDRMFARAEAVAGLGQFDRVAALAEEARTIHRQDVASCAAIGRLGAERVPDGATVLTHCNAGALATGGYGTALGVIRAARDAGKRIQVIADETRPYLQGARLTAWELARDGIPVTVIADSAAASLFAKGRIDLAVVGADRIAENGDVANKIGTYGVAALCHLHERPFFVAAPWSTVDLECADGSAIEIEERGPRELTHLGERAVVPASARVENPAFDVTPARFVAAIFTERGAVAPQRGETLRALLRS
ncbi:MAG TPA: S-methyl-5-thioribose-1-phosphate isomerase [Polyangiaceae bacterium]|nr:S-methyl-5-thioribose-1-phosphate isomerase [Polyangiaceae bacterium]